jgi:hypothetical protein
MTLLVDLKGKGKAKPRPRQRRPTAKADEAPRLTTSVVKVAPKAPAPEPTVKKGKSTPAVPKRASHAEAKQARTTAPAVTASSESVDRRAVSASAATARANNAAQEATARQQAVAAIPESTEDNAGTRTSNAEVTLGDIINRIPDMSLSEATDGLLNAPLFVPRESVRAAMVVLEDLPPVLHENPEARRAVIALGRYLQQLLLDSRAM